MSDEESSDEELENMSIEELQFHISWHKKGAQNLKLRASSLLLRADDLMDRANEAQEEYKDLLGRANEAKEQYNNLMDMANEAQEVYHRLMTERNEALRQQAEDLASSKKSLIESTNATNMLVEKINAANWPNQ